MSLNVNYAEKTAISKTYNIDCIDFMKKQDDDFFDIAIVDPPYGIGRNWDKDRKGRFYKKDIQYSNKNIPNEEYFNELFRVSKHQIIWGGNYFQLPTTNSWIIWDKDRNVEKTFMSECELAWTSFNIPMRIVKCIWDGARKGADTGIKTIHPHQKPIYLYKWCLTKYAKKSWIILDTHLGSGSSRIAAYDLGFDFYGCEIDTEIYLRQEERFNYFKSQFKLLL